MKERHETLLQIFTECKRRGLVNSQRAFAKLLDVNENVLSAAINGNEKYLTDSLVAKAVRAYNENVKQGEESDLAMVMVIPTGARAGTLADFSESVSDYDCEKIVSPIRGADFAIQVTGDSMAPEYPSGCHIIIKKINEEAFVEWGKVYVLDTENGAVIKRIRRTDDPEVVECVSVNPAYQSFLINTKHIRGWYRVLMVLALK